METAEPVNDQPVCESCGQSFSCGARIGAAECWCFEIESDENALDAIARRYSDCLCRGCLEKKLELLLPSQTVATPAAEN